MVAVARALSGNVKLLLVDGLFEGLAPSVVLELFGLRQARQSCVHRNRGA
jgi:branched-chain amino acid transport system ATP-binding protein/branched-chain amino acid transport system permease protein